MRRFGLTRNIMRHVDLPAIMNEVAYKTLLSTGELRRAVGARSRLAALGRRLIRSTDVFTIAIKPFMDRHSYDQDRIANCCHHLMDTHGRAVSFCEYNALVRPARLLGEAPDAAVIEGPRSSWGGGDRSARPFPSRAPRSPPR